MASALIFSALCVGIPDMPDLATIGVGGPQMPHIDSPSAVSDPIPMHESGGEKPVFEKVEMEKTESGEAGEYYNLAQFLKDSVGYFPKKKMEAGEGFQLSCPDTSNEDHCTYYITVQKKCDCTGDVDGGLTEVLSKDKQVKLMGSCGGLFGSGRAPTDTFRIELQNGGKFFTYLTSPSETVGVWDGSYFRCDSLLSRRCAKRFDCNLPEESGCENNDVLCPPVKESACSAFCHKQSEEEL